MDPPPAPGFTGKGAEARSGQTWGWHHTVPLRLFCCTDVSALISPFSISRFARLGPVLLDNKYKALQMQSVEFVTP